MKTRAKFLGVLIMVLILTLICGVAVSARGASVSVSVTAYNTGSEVTVSLLQGDEVKFSNFITLPEGGNKTTRTVEVTNVSSGTYDIIIESEGCVVSRVNGITVDRAINLALYDNSELNSFELAGGDINSDGFIDGTDVSGLVFDMTKPESEASYDYSDINGDGSRDAIDVSILAFNLFKPAPEVDFVSELPTYTALDTSYVEKVATAKGTEVTVTVSADKIDMVSADGSAITLDVAADRIDSGLVFSNWNPTVIGYSGSLTDKNGLILEISPVTADNGASFNMITHLSWEQETNILRKYIEYKVDGASDVHVKQIVLDTIDITGENKLLNVFGDMSSGYNAYQYNSHPAYLTSHFMGIEFPVATTNDSDDGTELYIQHVPEMDMVSGFWYTSKTEICGLADGKDSEEAFWDYMYPRLRLNANDSSEFFFNYDTWWSQYVMQFDEERILDLMQKFYGGISKYGATVKCFTLDHGWSNLQSIWEIDKNSFPDEFANIEAYAKENGNGSSIGFWYSPASSYPGAIDALWADQNGYKYSPGYSGLCMWDDNYKEELKKNIYYNVHEYNIGNLRGDGLYLTCNETDHGHVGDGTAQATFGTGTVEHAAENYIEVMQAAIEGNPDIFINSINNFSVSNPSPWWMQWVSATNANMGNDIPKGRVPAPDYRASYTTARDFFALQGLCNYDIPAEAQEVFGLVHQTTSDFTNDFVSVLFRGHFFIDMYVNDDFMGEERYERLAAMMNWAEANADSLLGGTTPVYYDSWNLTDVYPLEFAIQTWREPYGFAHDGLVMIRNPWVEEAEKVIEVPKNDGGTYDLISLYPEVRVYAKNVQAGEKVTVKLSGYETVVFATEAPGVVAQDIYTPAQTITVEPIKELDYKVEGNAITASYSANINVTDERNQLLVLFEAVTVPKTPNITIKVDGVEQAVEYRGNETDTEDVFYADGNANPECWLFAIVDIPAGEHTLEIDFTDNDSLLAMSAYIWSTHTTATAATHPNMLPHPEVLSGDSHTLYSVNMLEGNKFVFANCDDVTQTSNLTLELESENIKEGTGALKAVNPDTVVTYPVMLGRAFDFSAFEEDGLVHLWVYISDNTKITSGLARVELSHDSGAVEKNFTYWNISNLANGWNELILPISDAAQNNADFSKINYFRFYQYVNGPVTIIVDDIYIGLPEHMSSLHTVTFAGGSATGGVTPAAKSVTGGSSLLIPENSFTNYGNTFTGWLCSADSAVYQPGDTYTVGDADVTFTAQWQEGKPTDFVKNLALYDTTVGAASDTIFFFDGKISVAEWPTASEVEGKVGYVSTAHEGTNIIQRHPITASVWQFPQEDLALALDFYIEDVTKINASGTYFNLISGVNAGYLQAYLPAFGAVQNGWNSISVKLSDMNAIIGTFDLFDITAVSIGIVATDTVELGMANVRLVYAESSAPVLPENEILLALDTSKAASDTPFIIGPDVSFPTAAEYDGKTAFGAAAPVSKGTFIIQQVANMATEGKTADKYMFTVDLYIEDITKIDLATSSTRIIIGPSQADANGGAWIMPFASANLVNGWNKIELPLVDTYYTGALDVSEITILSFSAINIHCALTGDTVIAAANAKLVEASEITPEEPAEVSWKIFDPTALDASYGWNFYNYNGTDAAVSSADAAELAGKNAIAKTVTAERAMNHITIGGLKLGTAVVDGVDWYTLLEGCDPTAEAYNLEYNVYISDVSQITGDVVVKVQNDRLTGGIYWNWTVSASTLTNGWNTLVLPLDAAHLTGTVRFAPNGELCLAQLDITMYTANTAEVVIGVGEAYVKKSA